MTFDKFIGSEIYVKATDLVRAHYLYLDEFKIYPLTGCYYNYEYYHKGECRQFTTLNATIDDLYVAEFLEDETNE